MKYMPHHSLFLLTLFTGTLIALSSNHWIYIWIGLEINLLSFIPLILHRKRNQETEAATKYFLVQALGSSLILLSSLSVLFSSFSILSANLTTYTLALALIIKIGAAPFHFWLPQIILNIRWVSCIILRTWQKIAPLFIIVAGIASLTSSKIIILQAVIRTLIGGIGGLNQTHLRPLLAYSSIRHLGWIIRSSIISTSVTLTYFVTYSLITVSIILICNTFSVKKNYISSFTNLSLPLILSLILLFLSLAGLPPLLGFLPKWLIIKCIIAQRIYIYVIIIILGSLIRLFYYLSIFFNLFLNSSLKMHENKTNFSIMVPLSIITTLTLGVPPLLILYALILFNKP